MATGITQPGGNGGDIIFQDDTVADASLDAIAGSYSAEDWYQKSVALGWKALDGITPAIEKWNAFIPIYWFHVSVQNGDGVLTSTTTWRQGLSVLVFDQGKTYKVNGVGIANRWTIFGTLQETSPGDPMGYDGPDITFGAITTIDGNHQLYGSELRCKGTGAQQINIRRTSTSAAGDMVHVRLETYSTTVGSVPSVGTTSVPTVRARHIVMNVWGVTGNGVGLMNCLDAQDIELGGISGVRLASLTAYTYVRDMRIAGAPASADIRGSTTGSDLLDQIWSGLAAQIQQANNPVSDWRTYQPVSQDALTGSPLAGDTITVRDRFGNVVVGPVVTDALGNISFTTAGIGTTMVPNAIKARSWQSGAWVENGPFVATLSKLGYADTVMNFSWPRTSGSFGDQLLKVFDIVPRSLTPPPPVILVDQVPLPAHGEVRFESVIPAIA